jgi:hypothetical protein
MGESVIFAGGTVLGLVLFIGGIALTVMWNALSRENYHVNSQREVINSEHKKLEEMKKQGFSGMVFEEKALREEALQTQALIDDYNARIETVPLKLVSWLFGFDPQEDINFLKNEEAASEKKTAPLVPSKSKEELVAAV